MPFVECKLYLDAFYSISNWRSTLGPGKPERKVSEGPPSGGEFPQEKKLHFLRKSYETITFS